MNITPDYLLQLTSTMPMKQIDVLGQPYLQRYFAGRLFDGLADVWIHRFLSCDGDLHVHNHPWQGVSFVLNGGYRELYQDDHFEIVERERSACGMSVEQLEKVVNSQRNDFDVDSGQFIHPMHWHRIASVQPDTWTLIIVGPDRLPKWWFRNDSGELEEMTGSAADWWKACKPRAETIGAAA